MDEIQVFENDQFGAVRVKMINGDPWFAAKDVCDSLGVNNVAKTVASLDDDEKGITTSNTLGGEQEIWFVSEPGLYSIVLRSRKPEAKQFKRWVTHDVIPTIRKTGGYVHNENLFVETYLPTADDATKKMFGIVLSTLRQQNELIAEQKPMVEFANHVGNTDDTISVAEMAKLANKENICIGRNRLFAWLREGGMCDENNVAYQRYIDQGYFKVIEAVKDNYYGARVFPTTRITGKGQRYIIKKLRDEFAA